MKALYTIDTCSINDFLQLNRIYDKEVFESLWQYVDKSCDSGEIISHKEVYDEVLEGDIKAVTNWAKSKDNFFKDYDLPKEAIIISKIGDKYPNFLHQKKTTPAHADPWLIAQAHIKKLTVITSEKANNITGLPFVAKKFGVEVIDLVSFFKQRGIKV